MAQAFTIHCTTGCSCCRYENHYRGPYSTREIAESRKKLFHDTRLLASQFSANGEYSIEEHEAEILPDGRLIISNQVFEGYADPDSGRDSEMDGGLFSRG